MAATTDVASVLADFRTRFMTLFETGELKALSELYAEDCRIMVPGKEMQQGRAVAMKAKEMMKAAGIVKIVLQPVETVGSGDLAYECYENSYLKEDGTVADKKKMLVVLKKVGGTYFIQAVCYNGYE